MASERTAATDARQPPMRHTDEMSGRAGGLHRRVAWLLTAAVLASAAGAAGPPFLGIGGSGSVFADAVTSAFVAVAPCRLADTRSEEGFTRISPTIIEVQVSGRCDLPAELVAAAFVVTAVIPRADGHVTVYPAHLATPPTTSNVNTQGYQTRANGAVVQVSPTGAVRVHSPGPGDLVLDATGGFVAAADATAGRLVAISPVRAFDSRHEGAGARVPAGGTVHVPLPAGVPADATALAITLTAAGAVSPGYATAFPAGAEPGDASHLNFDTVDPERASAAIVQVSPTGLSVRTSGEAHLIVDVTAYFTGDTAASSTDGLFVPMEPTRVVDTRRTSPLGVSVPLYRDGALDLALPQAAAAAVLNLTVTATSARGHLSARAGGAPLPPTSSLNAAHSSDTAAAMWLGAASTTGVRLSSAGMSTHMVVDQFGWFTGVPPAPTLGAAANTPNGAGCLPGVGKLDPTKRWYRQDNTSASTSTIAYYPLAGPRGAVAVVGDSLTWQTMSNTMNRLIDAGFGPICADGAVFRATTVVVSKVNSGVNAIGRLKGLAFWAAATVRWVISIGTNDVGTASTTVAQRARIDGVIAAVGVTTRSILWMNVRTRRGSYQSVETRFNQNLAATPNVTVIDWSAMVAWNPAAYITGADLVHLTAHGISTRPTLLANTLFTNT
jgi:hypothetical protein